MNKTSSVRTDPLVSVIVPVYHVEKELRKCLDSLLNQTFDDYEIILVNDGGSEFETELCEEYAESDPRIVYCYQENQGLSAARNTGLSLARGQWIMFADSDDWVHEDFIRKALEPALSSDGQVKMVIFDIINTDPNGHELGVQPSGMAAGVYPSDTVLLGRLTGKILCYAWNKLYSRELWNGITFPVGELWEDDAIIHELIDRAGSIAIIHDELCYKRVREESITGIAFRKKGQYYWVFHQRQRRYLFIRERHPEMMYVESGSMADAALRYAAVLSESRNTDEIRRISAWLRKEKVSPGCLRKRYLPPFYLLILLPGLFSSLFGSLQRHKLIVIGPKIS